MTAPAEIIDRIKKLLRLARSSNPHEAALALQRALALAAEHHVAVAGLDADQADQVKATTHRETDSLRKLTYVNRYAAAICKTFFRVSPVETSAVVTDRDGWPRTGSHYLFIGTESDIEIALYVYVFLVRHFGFCWSKFRGRFRNRHAYIHGMFVGLKTKLWETMPPADSPEAKGTELAVAGHDAYILAVVGETTTSPLGRPDHSADAAAHAGYLQGRNTSIAPAIKRTPEATLALT